MQQEFRLTIDQVDFHFKRMDHPDLPVTYHVHFIDWHQHTVFRMRKDLQGRWSIVPMPLPPYVKEAEAVFRDAITNNEEQQ
jgi:hypothetical protein